MYWKLLKKHGKDPGKAVLSHKDFVYLKEIIENVGKIDLASLLDKLIRYFLERIECDIAVEAYRELYKVDVNREYACREIAKILAGWLIEAGRYTGVIKYKSPWDKDVRG